VATIDTGEFKTLLERERARLLHARSRLHADNTSSPEDESGEIGGWGTDNHLGDTASLTYDREFDEGIEEGIQDTLRQIDAALKRIEDGTYGYCEVCGKPIPVERLRAIPWAETDIEHAE